MKGRSTLLTAMSLVLFAACAKMPPVEKDPFFHSFYDQTRHIMSPEEIEIYRHLPDAQAKEEFITEFWLKRDPDPNTIENESRENFEERIEFANRHFNEHRGENRGWDTLRGRILLQLGFPEERRWGTRRVTESNGIVRDYPMETWYYYRHQLTLIFSDRDGHGEYELETYSPSILTAIENSRYSIDNALFPENENGFRFDSEYRPGEILITIPSRSLLFNEKDDRLTADFHFSIYVYEDYIKVDSFQRELQFMEDKETVLKSKDITLKIPYSPKRPGKYQLDIIGKALGDNQRYRDFCKLRF